MVARVGDVLDVYLAINILVGNSIVGQSVQHLGLDVRQTSSGDHRDENLRHVGKTLQHLGSQLRSSSLDVVEQMIN